MSLTRGTRGIVAVGLLSAVMLTGCSPLNLTSPITRRLHAPPQGYSAYPTLASDLLATMRDNAVLADMQLGDTHFVSGSSRLNPTGEYRLQSMMRLLDAYDDLTVFVYSDSRNVGLMNGRLSNVRRYLGDRGYGDTPIAIGFGNARGISGREGVVIFNDTSSGGGGTGTAGN